MLILSGSVTIVFFVVRTPFAALKTYKDLQINSIIGLFTAKSKKLSYNNYFINFCIQIRLPSKNKKTKRLLVCQ